MNVIFDMFIHFIYDHIISYLHLTPVITIGGFWVGDGLRRGAHPLNTYLAPLQSFSAPPNISQ